MHPHACFRLASRWARACGHGSCIGRLEPLMRACLPIATWGIWMQLGTHDACTHACIRARAHDNRYVKTIDSFMSICSAQACMYLSYIHPRTRCPMHACMQPARLDALCMWRLRKPRDGPCPACQAHSCPCLTPECAGAVQTGAEPSAYVSITAPASALSAKFPDRTPELENRTPEFPRQVL